VDQWRVSCGQCSFPLKFQWLNANHQIKENDQRQQYFSLKQKVFSLLTLWSRIVLHFFSYAYFIVDAEHKLKDNISNFWKYQSHKYAWIYFSTCMYVCVRGGPNQPLHRDPQWSIVLYFSTCFRFNIYN
jgi:hypothetical protein